MRNLNGENKITPCEKLGYKVGDRFKHKVICNFYETFGKNIYLSEDDGSELPRFNVVGTHDKIDSANYDYFALEDVYPIEVNNESRPSLESVKELTKALKELDIAYNKVKHLLNY